VSQLPRGSPGPRRIAIIGTTGAGKTTLAEQLSRRLAIPAVELDALYWDTGWKPAPREEFRSRVSQALGDAWIADGNYSQVRDLVWGSADTLIWLDMPLLVALWRVISRTVGRVLRRQVLWNGNRETIREALFSGDGLTRYLVQTHGRYRRELPALFDQPQYAHLRLVHLRSTRAVSRWLRALPRGTLALCSDRGHAGGTSNGTEA